MLPLPEYSRFAFSLIAAVGPVSAVPVFLLQTKGLSPRETSLTAVRAVGTAAFILAVAALAGQGILRMLGASLGSLQIAGGLAMLLMALPQLNPRPARDQPDLGQGLAAAIVPIGFPVLAGPASISSVIVAMRHGSGIAHAAIVLSCVLATCAVTWCVLRAAQSIEARIGQRGINALNRLFALLLASIAIEIITTGFRSVFPILG